MDLSRGFQYRVISEEGSRLSSGGEVPGAHDGMAAYQGPGNSTVLVRNHEGGDVDGSNPMRDCPKRLMCELDAGPSDESSLRK